MGIPKLRAIILSPIPLTDYIHVKAFEMANFFSKLFGNDKHSTNSSNNIKERIEHLEEGLKDANVHIDDLERRLTAAEHSINSLQKSAELTLSDFGNYKHRTNSELGLMKSQISTLLDEIEGVLEILEHDEEISKAKRLRTRLRNNYTRISNAQETLSYA